MEYSDDDMSTPDQQEPKDLGGVYDQFHGSGSLEWLAEEEPDAEYRAWLLTRPEDADLQQLSEQRTRKFERAPLKDKIMATTGYVLGAAVEVAFVVNNEISWLTRLGVGTLAAWTLFIQPAESIRRRIPKAKQDAQKQRQLHEHYFGVE